MPYDAVVHGQPDLSESVLYPLCCTGDIILGGTQASTQARILQTLGEVELSSVLNIGRHRRRGRDRDPWGTNSQIRFL